ncbi:MAG: hypothetical protein DWH99_10785 [Planctomycetota bacterium]|nr:MAG: hypothetical protein DWH99_10785 [Planctomycetota bacterium]
MGTYWPDCYTRSNRIEYEYEYEYEYRDAEYEYGKMHEKCIASDFVVLVLVLSETVLVLDGCSKLRRCRSWIEAVRGNSPTYSSLAFFLASR